LVESLGELAVERGVERVAERSGVTMAACSKGRKAGDFVEESVSELPVAPSFRFALGFDQPTPRPAQG
jgi:hypothetical protein